MGERVLIAQGRKAEVFALPDGTVLKLMREPAHEFRVHREAAALQAPAELHDHRGPRALRAVAVDGRPGLVMERVDGTDLLTALGRRPLSVFGAATVMANVHATMHECAAPGELPDLRDETPIADVARTHLLHLVGLPPPGAPVVVRRLAPIGRRILSGRYLAIYRRHRPVDQRLLERWEVVRAAARLWEPVPSEHPALLRIVRDRLPALVR